MCNSRSSVIDIVSLAVSLDRVPGLQYALRFGQQLLQRSVTSPAALTFPARPQSPDPRRHCVRRRLPRQPHLPCRPGLWKHFAGAADPPQRSFPWGQSLVKFGHGAVNGKNKGRSGSPSLFCSDRLLSSHATFSPAKSVLSFPLQNSNGIYTGFIKVQMELCRPPQTAPNSGRPAPSSNGCMNTLHISSTNTVGEVIEALLKKFLVTESPAKFALYKRCYREDQGTRPRLEREWSLLSFVSLVLSSRRKTSGHVRVGRGRARDGFWKARSRLERRAPG